MGGRGSKSGVGKGGKSEPRAKATGKKPTKQAKKRGKSLLAELAKAVGEGIKEGSDM